MGEDRRASAEILLKPPGGEWRTLAGGDAARGIVAEGLTCSVNEGGPDTLGFAVKRDPSITWADLAAFNQCQVKINGSPVWGGRVWEAPVSDGGDHLISVAGRGWQYHLDDDYLATYYVRNDLGGWRDVRSVPGVSLSGWPTAGTVSGTSFGWGRDVYATNATAVGITLDLGEGNVAKRIIAAFTSNAANNAFGLYARTHDGPDALFSSNSSDAFSTGWASSSSPIAGTFSTGYRYVSLFLYRQDGSSGVTGADHQIAFSSIQVFADTAYESGNVSVLSADQVFEDILASGALPLLDSDTSLIAAGTFSIPALGDGTWQTPRQYLAAANAYEGNLVGVTHDRRLFSIERASVPTLEIGAWSGSNFRDASTNAAEALYNRVVVQGQTTAGLPISVVRTTTSSLLTRQGFNRTALLQVGVPSNAATLEALGDIWLAEKGRPKFKGTAEVQGHGGARRVQGGGVHASELLLHGGDMFRIGHLDDPLGEGTGRDAVIKQVTYTHDDEKAVVELDNDRGNFEAFLTRYDVVASAAIAGIS